MASPQESVVPNSNATHQPGFYAQLRQRQPIPLDAELRCDPGEVLALVGPSGSGKTTLLRCITGLYRPQQGKVACSGAVWLDTTAGINLPPQRRRAGMLFQDYALFPHLSALENVRLALGGLPASQRTRRAIELLQRVHLQGLESRLPRTLSGGQQQRVALARALARAPQVLLLDEPFSAVDQVTRRKLRLEMAQLTKALYIPILLVTHDLDEACMLADRMCVLHYGKTLQVGEPQEVMRRPKDATIARLIDVRNLFEAEVVEQEPSRDATRLLWLGHNLEAPHAPEFPVGAKLCWCIPATDVLLHRRVQPSRGVRENPVKGCVREMVSVGGVTNVLIELDNHPQITLHMDLPPHVIGRNLINIDDEIGVSLLKKGIHLMPWQKL